MQMSHAPLTSLLNNGDCFHKEEQMVKQDSNLSKTKRKWVPSTLS